MEPEERQEVTQLLEFGEHTAAGRMTTEYIAVAETAVVDDAIDALRGFEGGHEALATIYLTGPAHQLTGAVPLVKIATSSPAAQLSQLSEPYISCAPDTPDDEVAELFDKYNLLTLAVVDEHGRLAGIITADDVIAMLQAPQMTDAFLKTLEGAAAAVFRGRRPRLHHRQRRQRRRRHLDLLAGRRAVRLLAALDDDSRSRSRWWSSRRWPRGWARSPARG